MAYSMSSDFENYSSILKRKKVLFIGLTIFATAFSKHKYVSIILIFINKYDWAEKISRCLKLMTQRSIAHVQNENVDFVFVYL